MRTCALAPIFTLPEILIRGTVSGAAHVMSPRRAPRRFPAAARDNLIRRRCSDTDNDPDRCSVVVWSLESCHTDRSPATNDAGNQGKHRPVQEECKAQRWRTDSVRAFADGFAKRQPGLPSTHFAELYKVHTYASADTSLGRRILQAAVVSRQARNFLRMVQDEPIFNLKCLNDRLYHHTQTMREISSSREKLRLLGEYLMTCRSGALQELSTSLDQRDYLLDCAHTYSVRDLMQIANGGFDCCLQSALEFASSHVYQCELCSQRGFICQICNQDEIIYPFQFDTTTRCGDCKAVFHKPCKTPAIRCPRCERRKKCHDKRVLV
ncbi:unnamed protein product [Ranitomeya imitator]|uniref:Rubicon Homology domain-containing protein n=1 Tax=Ranitomeya imitator TaxID=111125 RepID=A0ABN9M905_9NEOB|nr:unnamed protein product [Ranitomeya imitator]